MKFYFVVRDHLDIKNCINFQFLNGNEYTSFELFGLKQPRKTYSLSTFLKNFNDITTLTFFPSWAVTRKGL